MFKLATLAVIATATTALADLGYTFDADAQGWGTLNDATGFTWDGTNGSPNPGFIRARDVGTGAIWYFAAPVVDLTNLSNAYGGSISWDVLSITGAQDDFQERADVMLVGGGLMIGISTGAQPVNGQWTSSSASLHVSSPWMMVSSLANGTLSATAATAGDIQTVLGSLTGLYIQGEYTNGGDAAGIDNVQIVVPAPSAAALLALGAISQRRRRTN